MGWYFIFLRMLSILMHHGTKKLYSVTSGGLRKFLFLGMEVQSVNSNFGLDSKEACSQLSSSKKNFTFLCICWNLPPLHCFEALVHWLCLLQLRRLMHQGRVPVTPSNQTEVITGIPGLPRLHPSDIPTTFFHDTPPSNYDFTCRHFLRIATSSVILVNSFEELEEVALHGLRTQAVSSEFVKVSSLAQWPNLMFCSQKMPLY